MNETEQAVQSGRGLHDILPDRAEKYCETELRFRRVFSLYGYREIRTPVLEPLALFERAIGQQTDIVEKEMFTLKDRGDRMLCLRPEGTAGIVRAFIENNLAKVSAISKLFYIGPMFRAERPQKGRYREFYQAGCEYFGNDAPSADAETIALLVELLSAAGIQSLDLRINTIGCPECRPAYQKALLEFLRGLESSLCNDCKRRMERNPIRALDCKTDADKLKSAPRTQDHLCAACAAHDQQVHALLKEAGVECTVSPSLVRGLDYYSRTVFEVYARGKSESQDALAAGGRYDGLVTVLGGEPCPAVGFAVGVERVLNYLEEQSAGDDQKAVPAERKVFVAALGSAAILKSFALVRDLRRQGIRSECVLNSQSLKSQMRMADSIGARFCLILGDDELKENVVMVRDLQKKSQQKVSMNDIVSVLKNEE